MASPELLKALAVTAELTGTEMSPEAAKVMAEDLSAFPEQQVFGSLTRCRRELRSRLTLADIITRLDDGRPGADEAWASVPHSEEQTVVWTNEMIASWSVAEPLLCLGDEVAARMAFKQAYDRAVSEARTERKPPQWQVSLGWDKAGRESVIARAVELKRISVERAQKLLLEGRFAEKAPALEHDKETLPIGALLDQVRRAVKKDGEVA